MCKWKTTILWKVVSIWYILSIKDIVENGRFKPRDYICGVLNSNSLLVDFRYTKLKNAIPKIWIKRISEFNTYDGNSNQTDDTDLHVNKDTRCYTTIYNEIKRIL